MTFQALIHKHSFEEIIPELIPLDPENVPGNLYAFKEAYDDLLRMQPSDAGSEQIEITLEVETDSDGRETERYYHAFHCEGDEWDSCLAKEVVFKTEIGEAGPLHRISRQLWEWVSPSRPGSCPNWRRRVSSGRRMAPKSGKYL